MKSIQQKIEDLHRTGFWGSLEIMFQNGEPVMIKQVQTMKVDPQGDERSREWTKREQPQQRRA
jgi:hypothetical protein